MRSAPMFFGGGGIGTTLSPANKDVDAVLFNQNQTLTGSVSAGAGAGVAAVFTGGQKLYFEAFFNNVGGLSKRAMAGVQWSGIAWSVTTGTETEVGVASLSVGFDAKNGNIWINGSTSTTMGTTFASNDVMNIAVDTTGSGKIWVGKNGAWLLSGNPAAGTGSVTTLPNTSVRPALSVQDGTASITLLAGPTLLYAPPAGFSSI